MSKLNKNIRKLRIKAGLTQEELAKKIGKSKNVISNWERGDNRPDADTIEVLCSILNVTPNELMGWDDKPTTIAAHFDGEEFSPEEQEEIKNFIQYVLSKRKK